MACNVESRPTLAVTLFASLFAVGALFSVPASAEVIARWDFADEDLVADEANAANAAATIATSGNSSFVSCSSNCAANFSSLNTLNTSEVVINIDTSLHADVSIAFSTRTSGTASKYWRVQANAGAGFVDLDPLIEEDSGGGFLDHNYSLGAFGDDVIAVRLVATDSVGDGSGEFIQADGEGAPSTAGTLRLDDILVEGTPLLDDGGIPVEPEPIDAGEPEPPLDGGVNDGGIGEDGGLPPEDAGVPLSPVLVVSELFFNVASGSDLGEEWLELQNLSDQNVPLDGVTIESTKNITPVVERSHTFVDTGVILAPGERIVIAQQSDLGVEACVDALLVVVDSEEFSFSQSASTQKVHVFAPARGDVPAFEFTLQYKGGDAPETASTNGASITFNDDTVGFEADCAYAPDAFGTPGLPAGACPVDAFACPDGGAPSPEGTPEEPEPAEPEVLPPNSPPTIVLDNVSSTGTGATIRWTATDAEDGDSIDVALFYDTDGEGFDGVLIARGLSGGQNQSFAWDLDGAPSGTYRIFGRATDSRGESVYGYAQGAVQVGSEQGGVATLVVVEPDGVNDGRDDGNILISWEALLPIGATGSVSLFYDSDDTGFDGTPIAAGLPLAGEGATLLWTPVDVEPGTYSIYAVLDWTGGQTAAYGAFVSLGETGCSCDQVGGSNLNTHQDGSVSLFQHLSPLDLLCPFAIAILGFLLSRRPRRRTRSFRADSFSRSA